MQSRNPAGWLDPAGGYSSQHIPYSKDNYV
ncbi:MAG: hypothetical protein ICCCNLDF_03256 [Planctomycetes bacterium]|nr:hypothetical protein [Planctomycetota bacterium]